MILLERIRPTFHNHRRSEQAGFTAGRSTTEHIFAIRQIIEKSKEFNKSTYIAFIDFKAAFDSVSRDSLWKILQICDVPHELSVLVRQLYTDTRSAVRLASSLSEEFSIETGVKQGCVIAPYLFNCVIDHLMRRLLSRCNLGIQLGEYQLTDLDYIRGRHRDLCSICVRATRSSDNLAGRSQPCGDANQLAEDKTHGYHLHTHQPSAIEDLIQGSSSVCRFLHMSRILDHE